MDEPVTELVEPKEEGEEEQDQAEDAEGSGDEISIYADDENKFFTMMKTLNRDDKEDAATVATSAVGDISAYSGVPTSYFSGKVQEFSAKLNAEKP